MAQAMRSGLSPAPLFAACSRTSCSATLFNATALLSTLAFICQGSTSNRSAAGTGRDGAADAKKTPSTGSGTNTDRRL